MLCLTFTNLGCGKTQEDIYPVRGIVKFPDGQLLREGTIEFEIIGPKHPVTARGQIGPDGSFVLGTRSDDDGALVGDHRVVVIADHEIGNGAERPGLIPTSQVHPKHRDYRRSGLVYRVKPEVNNLVIEIEYAEGQATAPQN